MGWEIYITGNVQSQWLYLFMDPKKVPYLIISMKLYKCAFEHLPHKRKQMKHTYIHTHTKKESA